MLTIDLLTLGGTAYTDVSLEVGLYPDSPTAKVTVWKYAQKIATLSYNLGQLIPEHGAFFVKDTEPTEGIVETLTGLGLVKATGATVTTPHEVFHEVVMVGDMMKFYERFLGKSHEGRMVREFYRQLEDQ